MKPLPITETQKMRTLMIGITPVTAQEDQTKKVYRTQQGCRVVTHTDDEGEHVTLSCTGIRLQCISHGQ